MSAFARAPQDLHAFLAAPPVGIADARAHAEGVARLAERVAADLLARAEELVPVLAAANNFSRVEAVRACRAALEGLRADRLMAIREGEGAGGRKAGFTVVFAGGAIPQPTILAAVAAAMVSERVLLRPSSGDPWLVSHFINHLVGLDDGLPDGEGLGLRRRLIAATWQRDRTDLTREIIHAANAVVLYGDGPTVSALRRMGREEARWFIYGPRTSVAMLDSRAVGERGLNEAAHALADDVMAYNQLGCLSPSTLVIAGEDTDAEGFARRLGEAIAARISRDGRAPILPAATALEIQSLRAIHAMRPGCAVMGSEGLPGWTLLIEGASADAERPLHEASPGYQTLFIRTAPTIMAAIKQIEASSAGGIQCVAMASDAEGIPAPLRARLEAAGVSRVCGFGDMQSPPLEWTHDGNPFFPV